MYTRENRVVECIRPHNCKMLTHLLFCFALCTVSVYHTSPYCRGEEFRPDYKKAASLRSVFTDCPCLALSAMLTEKVLADVVSSLHVAKNDVVVKAVLPDRPNIYLEVRRRRSYYIATELEWIAKAVESDKELCPKTLVFAHTINYVSAIYSWLMSRLRENGYRNKRTYDPKSQFVFQFHAHIAQPLQQYTLSKFAKPNSSIRVLVCTVAFGMKIAIGDVRQVVHWGQVASLMTFWQKVGRCGKDGESLRPIWYPK